MITFVPNIISNCEKMLQIFLCTHIGISFYNVRIYLKQCFLIVCNHLQNISDFFLGHKMCQIIFTLKRKLRCLFIYPFCSEK